MDAMDTCVVFHHNRSQLIEALLAVITAHQLHRHRKPPRGSDVGMIRETKLPLEGILKQNENLSMYLFKYFKYFRGSPRFLVVRWLRTTDKNCNGNVPKYHGTENNVSVKSRRSVSVGSEW